MLRGRFVVAGDDRALQLETFGSRFGERCLCLACGDHEPRRCNDERQRNSYDRPRSALIRPLPPE